MVDRYRFAYLSKSTKCIQTQTNREATHIQQNLNSLGKTGKKIHILQTVPNKGLSQLELYYSMEHSLLMHQEQS